MMRPNNKFILRISVLIVVLSTFFHNGYSQSLNLPRTNIFGREYYVYKAQKDDSTYGITKNHGWDYDILLLLNPQLKESLSEGMNIYYPVSVAPSVEPQNIFKYTVRRGDDIYKISNKFDVPVVELYELNPSAKYQIKEDEIINIPLDDDNVVEHIVTHGETLWGLAAEFGTRIEDIMKLNPGLNEHNLQAGKTIKIDVGSRYKKLIKEQTTQIKLVSLTPYKVKRNDTWESIASNNNLEISILRSANPGISELEKDLVINIPDVIQNTVETMIPEIDPRESTPEGIEEIFQEIESEKPQQELKEEVRVYVLLEDYETYKDMEFARGVISAVDELKNSPFKIIVKISDGKESADNIMSELNKFTPDIIFINSEKTIPEYISSYAQDNNVYTVNMFNVKSDLYQSNPYLIQLLTPSEYYYDSTARAVNEKYGDYKLLIAGEPDATDNLLESLFKFYAPSSAISIPAEGIKDFQPVSGEKYLIYGTATKKADVKSMVENLKILKEKAILSDIAVLGRPNWIAYVDAFKELYSGAEVMIPSRSFFDSELTVSRDFINSYKSRFGHTPMKSFPVYSVAGYDAAHYFIPAVSISNQNFEIYTADPLFTPLQNEIVLKRANDNGGLYNAVIYLVKFNSFGNIDKIRVE